MTQRRYGEMLKAIPPKHTGRPATGGNGSTKAPITRRGAARKAGITKKQQQTALKLADIPEDEFKKAVDDSDTAPTVSELADAADAIGFDLLLDWITDGPPRPPDSHEELDRWARDRGQR